MRDNKDINIKVKKFYEKFQYPSPSTHYKPNFVELVNMCDLFSAMYEYDFNGKKILDVGTGTGDRIIEVAKRYSSSKITAIDFCSNSIKIAKTKAEQQQLENISFKEEDIINLESVEEKFDVIFAMGVLHHLDSPERGVKILSELLNEGGILFCYLYGIHGGVDRLRQKKIIECLSSENPDDLNLKLKICKELKIIPKEYGWSYGENIDAETFNVVLADCFFNVNEKQYDYDEIEQLLNNKNFYGFNIIGITVDNIGLLVNLDIDNMNSYSPMKFEKIQKTEFLSDIYRRLSVKDRYRLMDMFYKPNGYTIVCWKSKTVLNNEKYIGLRNSYVPLF